MTLHMIQRKAQQLHARNRRDVLRTAAGPVLVVLCCIFCLKEFPALTRVWHPLFTAALLWSLAGVYFLTRKNRSAPMPGDTGLSAGIEFCRREIERRRDHFRRVTLWTAGPAFLSVGAIVIGLFAVAPKQVFPNALPFLALVLVWIAAYFFIVRLRQQRKLQREIDELNELG